MRAARLLALLLATLPAVFPQGIIRTVAGTDWNFPASGGPAANAPLGAIERLALAPNGSLYVADPENNMVFRVDPQGTLTIVAGNGAADFYGDGGLATAAALHQPSGVALDTDGNVYIADSANDRIRKVTAKTGYITTVAGTGFPGYNGDGTQATLATLFVPQDVAIDSLGDLYIADSGNNRIRKVSTATGFITTIAGTGEAGFSGDGGPPTEAMLDAPEGLAFDAAGRLYIALNRRVRRIADGKIETLAGMEDYFEPTDGVPALQSSLGQPKDVAVTSGAVYLADAGQSRVRRIDLGTGIITTVAGNGTLGFAGDGGLAELAALNGPRGVAVDAQGNVVVSDSLNNRIRKRAAATGTIATVAGNNAFKFGGDGRTSTAGLLNFPSGIARAANGDLYVADRHNHRVRRITPAGVISTIAGNGNRGYSGDGGPAVDASFTEPIGLALDAAGNLYVADSGNGRVRRINLATGAITTVAGGGGLEPPGKATLIRLDFPQSLAVDATGNLYITEAFRIWKVTPAGELTAFAGDGNSNAQGDGGPATEASLEYAGGLAIDPAGNVYVTELYRGVVRRITPDGAIDRYAGVPLTDCCRGDGGPALMASIDTISLAFDSDGSLYVGGSDRVRKITPAGIISTVAGGGEPPEGSLGDGGSALEASLSDVEGVLAAPDGSLYIADAKHDRLRQVLAIQPPFSVSTDLLTFSAKSGGAPSAPQTVRVTSLLTSLPFMVTTNTNDGNWLTATPAAGLMPGVVLVTADPAGLTPRTHEGTVIIHAPDANPSTRIVTVSFNVAAADNPTLSVGPESLLFDFVVTQPADSQTIEIRNIGSGNLTFNLTATTTTGGDWLRIDSTGGAVTAVKSATVQVTANPADLGEGTYSGLITAESPGIGRTVLVPVTMVVHASTQTIVLSQDGISFQAARGSPAPLRDFFAVLNTGLGAMSWAAASTTSGGNWLTATPASGESGPSGTSPGYVNVQANTASLDPGDYYGTITITSPGAVNSPQVVSVVLRVTAADTTTPDVRPTGLLFTGLPGGQVAPQEALLTNVGASDTSFRSTATADSGPLFFSYQPSAGTLPPAQPARISVQPNLTGLTPGVRRGRITLEFSDQSARVIEVVLVVPGNTGLAAVRNASIPALCAPENLNLVFSLLGQQFQVVAGFPSAIEVTVADDCGGRLNEGSVMVSFSNGDEPLSLVPIGDGRWAATWQPAHAAGSVRLVATAESSDRSLRGTTQATGMVSGNSSGPVVLPGSVLNGASLAPRTLVAPGGIISIFGDRLSDDAVAGPVPRVTELNRTVVALGGLALPLLYVGQQQINAIVPYGIPPNSTQQLIVQNGPDLTVPLSLPVAAAQPAVFSTDNSGKGQGHVYSSAGLLANAANPVHAGDALVIYCAGLGEVAPAVPAGFVAPADPLSRTVSPVTATIGGQDAQVLFAGLAPGYTGLYQVNVVVPEGVTPGDAAELVLTVAGQSSPPVTIAVK